MSDPLACRRALRITLWLYGVAAALLCLDQLTKALVLAFLSPDASIRVLGPLMSLTRRTNTGGAFSILQDCPGALVAVSIVTLLAILILGPRLAGTRVSALAGLGLVAGGAAGNVLDRLRFGRVVDFLDFHIWPVFNVADIGIVVGAVLVVLAVTFAGRSPASKAGP